MAFLLREKKSMANAVKMNKNEVCSSVLASASMTGTWPISAHRGGGSFAPVT